MDFNDYSYLWPPRPDNKIAQGMLNFYEKQGFWAQAKRNGTCTVIFAKGKQVIFKTRHNDGHKKWSPTPEHVQFFRGHSDWNVYVAELLHSKTPHIKNQLFIFDKIVADGKQLVGTTLAERQELLTNEWEPILDEPLQTRVHDNVSIAKNFKGDFVTLFNQMAAEKKVKDELGENYENEGLVLKNPKAVLSPCFKQDSNNKWQVKCRLPHKNYSF